MVSGRVADSGVFDRIHHHRRLNNSSHPQYLAPDCSMPSLSIAMSTCRSSSESDDASPLATAMTLLVPDTTKGQYLCKLWVIGSVGSDNKAFCLSPLPTNLAVVDHR